MTYRCSKSTNRGSPSCVIPVVVVAPRSASPPQAITARRGPLIAAQAASAKHHNHASRRVVTDPLAVDAGGDLWVGDVGRLERFDPGGGFVSQLELPGAGQAETLGVFESLGETGFYLVSAGVAGVQRLDGLGMAAGSPYPLDGVADPTTGGSGDPRALASTAGGGLFVSDQPELTPRPNRQFGPATFLEYGATGVQSEAFATGAVIGNLEGNAIAFGEKAQALYDAPRDAKMNIVQMFSLAVPGPLPEEGGGLAEGVGKTAAVLVGNVDPEGAATTYRFQFLSEAQFKADGESFGAGTQETPVSVLAGADFAEHLASALVSGLTPDTTYRFRLVAINSNAEPGGVDGETASLGRSRLCGSIRLRRGKCRRPRWCFPRRSIRSAIRGTTGSNISPTRHTIGTSKSPWTRSRAPARSGGAGGVLVASGEDQGVSQLVEGLSPSSVYRYRVVAFNETIPGGIAGPVLKGMTPSSSGPLRATGRSRVGTCLPPDKHGIALESIAQEGGVIQASEDGGRLAYIAKGPVDSEPAGNRSIAESELLATRSAGGWSTQDIATPHETVSGLRERSC